jgi:protocatechuate 3,4-dioxygenase, alpha subunit
VVLDGSGAQVKDVLIEAWQADASGVHAHPEDPRHAEVAGGFRGWGRVISDFDTGLYAFDTVKPGRVMGRNGRIQAPHISLWIVARGINIGLQTRLYFDEEAEANAADPVLNAIELIERRKTLIATRAFRDGRPVYRFDIRLQGGHETVFFDL